MIGGIESLGNVVGFLVLESTLDNILVVVLVGLGSGFLVTVGTVGDAGILSATAVLL